MQQDSIHLSRPIARDTVHTQPAAARAASPDTEIRQPAATDTLAGTPDTVLTRHFLPIPEPQTEETAVPVSSPWTRQLLTDDSLTLHPSIPRIDFQKDSVSAFRFTAEMAPLRGIAGEERPYRFKDDSVVTIVLLLSLFLMTWVFTRSRHYLSAKASEYFNNRRHRDNPADIQHGLNGKVLILLQTCCITGLILFGITLETQNQVFQHVEPYKILTCTILLSVGYYLVKIALYRFVNSIFFDRSSCGMWNETYQLHILLTGLLLLPIVLLIVYFEVSFVRLSAYLLMLIALAKALLLYKCRHIFFNYTLGWVHLFLYFCTLEIVPILFLIQGMIYTNNFLLTTNY